MTPCFLHQPDLDVEVLAITFAALDLEVIHALVDIVPGE